MDWRKLLEPDIQSFLHQQCDADVRNLALKKPPSLEWPYALILDQIKTRQKAKNKAPDLYKTSGFIFPSADVFEQASSSACANYKASLVSGTSFVDLTAGCGIDGFALAKRFKEGALIEKDFDTYEVLAHNLTVLKKLNYFSGLLSSHHKTAEDFLHELKHCDLIYIDPQRREKGRKGVFDLKSCAPDIVSLLPVLLQKSNRVMIKTSPVLDIHQTIELLGRVIQVHVVGWDGDCKEVVYILEQGNLVPKEEVRITAVDIDDEGNSLHKFSYLYGQEAELSIPYAMPGKFIYEPGPAFQKAGGYKTMAQTFKVSKLHPHSHLYTANRIISDFPGKFFEVIAVVPAQAKNLDISQAELSLRNFPGKAEDLRAKLKLKEGGNHRVFATTLSDNSRKLIICNKFS